jgi:hypothetical protein
MWTFDAERQKMARKRKSSESGPQKTDSAVEIVERGGPAGTRPGSFKVEVENMDGKSLHLRVTNCTSVLQIKRAIAREEGTPAFQQILWAEGAELQNQHSVDMSALRQGSKITLVKAEAGTQTQSWP